LLSVRFEGQQAPGDLTLFRCRLARADFARVLIVASELAAASRKVYDVFDEPGRASDDRDIAHQLEAVP
jgi:hypothetical protein